ncbi:MAG: leucine-rich repeat protein [Eubacterium sp.]|nr:leucine-rich repeat protein [Eubacterium sp.]
MACIDINSKILCNFNNENIAAALNEIIDNELSKDVSRMNTRLIDECVNALLELEKEENSGFKVLIPLINSNDFLKSLQPSAKRFKNMNVFARAALVAAIIAASAMTANAAYKNATGVDLLANIAVAVQNQLTPSENKNQNGGIIQLGDYEEEEEEETSRTTEPQTTHTSLPATENETSTTEKTKDGGYIEQLGDDEESEEETTTQTTKKQPENTTEKASIVEPENEPEKPYVTALEAQFDNFKTNYIYGEKLSYEGLRLTAVYSDKTKKDVALKDCDYTKSLNMNITANYTLRVIYEKCVVKIKITVRPDEETRGAEICSNDDFEYFLSKKGAYITKYKGKSTALNINTMDGKAVYAIGADVFKNSNIKSVSAVYVKKIFASAFENSEVESALFSNNITFLGNAVFRNSKIKELSLKGELTEIPESLCEGCSALTKITLPENTKIIRKAAFSDCTALETIINTANIDEAKDFAFYNCENAEADSSIPKIKKAGEYAFAYCRNIDFKKLSQSIEEINKYSFAYCNKLTEAEIPAGISTIPEGAFRGAHISALTLNEGLLEIEDYAFMSTEFRDLIVPNSVKKIGTYALYSVKLRDISFGRNVESLGENAIFKSTRVNMNVYKDTVPYEYAIENKINYTVIE